MAEIALSAAVRSNLNALQSTAKALGGTQHRLATGYKVSSAIQNPNSFFTAAGLSARANDLSNLLDDLGQNIQTVKAADEGIKAISTLVESAKAKANQAQNTSSAGERKSFAKQYNDLLGQIKGIAEDSRYNGNNLLAGSANNLTAVFNEDGSNKLVIEAVDYTGDELATNLGLASLVEGSAGATSDTVTFDASTTAASTLVSDSNFAEGDVITYSDGSELGSLEVTATTTVQDLVNKLDSHSDVSASFDDGTQTLSVSAEYDITVSSSNSAFNGGSALAVDDATDSGFATDTSINDVLSKLNSALGSLRSQASIFGTSLSVIENRNEFTKNLIDTLEVGAGKLTLADTNLEGANLLALQTRQSLSSTALSLSASADQNVLRLF